MSHVHNTYILLSLFSHGHTHAILSVSYTMFPFFFLSSTHIADIAEGERKEEVGERESKLERERERGMAGGDSGGGGAGQGRQGLELQRFPSSLLFAIFSFGSW